MDSAEHGVIYVSWGSLIQFSSMPEGTREELLLTFGALKQQIVWKFENDTLPNKPKNVYISKWLPQKDVLCK